MMDANYTDDIALLANMQAQAESQLHGQKRAAIGIGHHVNADKTEHFNTLKCDFEFYSDLKRSISRWWLLRRMCITEGSLTLDTPQNKSRSRHLFRAYDKQTNNMEASSGLDWPQTLVRGCQFTFTYTTKSSYPLRSQKNELLGLIILNVDIFPNPLLMFKKAIKRYREFMKALRGWDKIHAKEVKSTEEITQPKDFNKRVHLNYNKILIGDDQTNNDEI